MTLDARQKTPVPALGVADFADAMAAMGAMAPARTVGLRFDADAKRGMSRTVGAGAHEMSRRIGESARMPAASRGAADLSRGRDARHGGHITLSDTFHETDLPEDHADASAVGGSSN